MLAFGEAIDWYGGWAGSDSGGTWHKKKKEKFRENRGQNQSALSRSQPILISLKIVIFFICR